MVNANTANASALSPADKTPPNVVLGMASHIAATKNAEKLACQCDIHIGFFFDGFGRSRDLDDPASSRYSNICRLWEAHRDNKDDRRKDTPNEFWYSFYYSGLGTPLNDDAASNAIVSGALKVATNAGKAVMDKAKSTAKEATGVDKLDGVAKLASPTKIGTKALKDSLSEMSFRPVVKAYKDIIKDIQEAPENIRNVLRLAEGNEWVTRGKASVRGLLYDARKNPLKAGWAVAKTVFSDLIVDSIPLVRDSRAASTVFGTGVDARLTAALDQFEAAWKDAKAQIPKVRRIQVSVFGADRGAVIARAFVNELARKYKRANAEDLAIEGDAIDIKFLGMFDAVSSLIEENKLIGFLPLVGMVKQNFGDRPLGVPPAVKKCVHFAAAHELRFYQRLDSLEKTRGEQFLYPGTSEDITGGAPDGSMGFRAELQRVALRDMLNEALMAGVMLDRMEDLVKYKRETFLKFSLAAPINDGKSNYQMMDLIAAYRKIVPRTQGLDFTAHMKVFIQWLAVRYQSPEFRASVTSHADEVKAAQRAKQKRVEIAQAEFEAARAAKPFDQERYGRATGALFKAQQDDQSTMQKTIYELHRPFVSVWERLDSESKKITEMRAQEQKRIDDEPRRKSQWQKLVDEREAPWRAKGMSPPGMPPTYQPARPLMSAEESILADAWIAASSGKTTLPDEVMALFDLLVHDTMLTSWHDHLLSSTLYFQTRAADAFGVTDAKEEDETRKQDNANAARIKQMQESMQMPRMSRASP
jgi:regulator of protease activity HflC (stomatin/prohibitin superfamily)